MSRRTIKYTSLLTILLLCFYVLASLLPVSINSNVVCAATIENDDVYRGLAIALILVLLAKLGQVGEANPPEEEEREWTTYPDISNEDLELLARVIYAESRGEPYNGQVAVGAVVLNRLESPDFPDTIRGVIYQPNQFTSVNDGQINLIPNQTAYEAARDALAGNDPSLGALYFYNPDTAETLWWLSQREKTIKIGNHVFAK